MTPLVMISVILSTAKAVNSHPVIVMSMLYLPVSMNGNILYEIHMDRLSVLAHRMLWNKP